MSAGARDCLAIEEVIAFFEGRLGADALGSIEAHLDACAACRMWLSELAPTLGSNAAVPDAAEARAASFQPGVLVAGRYRIIRFVARGGMGEVYAAEDLDLGERVALKTVRAIHADDEKVIARFKREVSLARRVTHENVCRIFDLGTDEAPNGETVVFLTMELLDGEPLSERLRRGAFDVEQALPLVRQLAAALTAAHRVDVVHRDLKSSNVMLVPGADGPRVVVTDFGLAHDVGGGAGETLVGSPAYMAPEQVEGDTVDARTDVYALGVVLFEMVTGRLPFAGSSAAALAAQRLVQDPPSARSFVPSLPLDWDRAIARCLERRREARFASAREVLAALDGPSRRRRWTVAAAAALALAVVGVAGVSLRHQGMQPRHALRTGTAVAGFADRSTGPGTDTAWRGPALAELLSAELARSPELRLVPTATVAAMRRDLAVPVAERYDAGTLARMRRRVDAQWFAAGSFAVDGEALSLDVSLADAATGNVVFSAHERGSLDGMAALVARMGARLRAQLGLSAHGASDAGRALPANGEAARLYVDGLMHARASDPAVARPLLERAVAAAPEFAPAHAALADLYLGLKLHARARAEARQAVDRAAELPREEQLTIEALRYEANNDWPHAIEIYRALHMFYPDDLDDGLALARAQSLGGRSGDAVTTIAQLRRLPAPIADDPRIDQAEALAWSKQGEWKKRLAACERAISGARAMGARIMVAQGQLDEAETLIALGDLGRAEALYRDAQRSFDDMGDKSGAMEALVGLGDLMRSRGDSRAAAAIYERAIAFHESVGDEFGVADKLNGLAQITQDFGDLERAQKLYGQSLQHFRAVGEEEGIANVLNNSALILVAQDELDEAARKLDEAVRLYRDIGMRRHEAATLGNIAYVERRQGHLGDARAHLERCLQMLADVGDEQARMQFEADHGTLEREADRLDEARHVWQWLREVATRRKHVMFVQQAGVALAQLAVDAGDAAEGERQARAMATELAGTGAQEPEAAALAVLARALLSGKRAAEAATTAQRAWALVAHSQDAAARADARAVTVVARASAGECAAALREAGSFARETKARQPVDEQLEAALALGLAQRACGQGATARVQLAAVAARATQLGFRRIARLAR